MKKIFTLFISSIFTLSLLAFDGSRLSISTLGNNKNLKIEIDGRKIYFQDKSISIRNLNEGYHQVKIFLENSRENVRENRNGNGNGFGRRSEMIYNNSVYLKRGFVIDIIISRYGKIFIDENRMDRNSEWYNEDDDYDFGNENGNGYGNGNNGGGWNNGYGNVMNARDFDQLKESLKKEWFENNRITSVKMVTDKTNFTAQQVKDLMLLFVFENNKLEVAKYTYRKIVDKQNYYILNDALTFSSSKEELARFIRQNP
jgi:hypothetical protein